MRRKILALSLVLAMAASVLSPAAMAQTVSDSLPTVIATSESTSAAESESTAESVSTADSANAAESTSAAESESTAESVSTADSANAAESASAAESVSTAESTSTAESVSTPASAPAAENTTAAQPQADEVAIDETNFPDANFREFVKRYDTDKNGSFSQAELDAVTEIDVSNKGIQSLKGIEYFTALESLSVVHNQLTSLDVSKNTVLTELNVYNNQLTSLDVSANTALTNLDVSYSQLTSLDVSRNTALTRLYVGGNQLTGLDVSANAALTDLYAPHNQLTSLDVSANTALISLSVFDNQLTSLDVSANTALTSFYAVGNQLTALKLGHVPAFGYMIDNPTKVSLTAKTGAAIDLKTYAPFFDASKVSNLQGGTIDANGILTGWTSGSPVTYTYDAGFEQVLNVEITIQDEAQTTEVAIDETNFPDANFREIVKRYDTDGNGSFSQAELDAVTEIIASYKGIQNLKGIEYFTALTSLGVSGNQLTSLDVSANTALTSLDVGANQLTSLDVSGCTALTSLYVSDNQLTSLDVSANAALESLYVSNNQLTSLDVSTNTALKSLEVGGNQLTSLDVSANAALESLYVSNNQLTSLDVSDHTALTSLDVSGIYNDDGNKLALLDVSGCTALKSLDASNTQLTSLDVSGCTALTSLKVSNTQLTSLDMSANTALESLDVSSDQLMSLNVSKNTALTKLSVYSKQLSDLDLSNCTALTKLDASSSQLTSLDLSKNTALKELTLNYAQLTSLNLSANTELTQLWVYDTQLTTLDLSKNTALTYLFAGNNRLSALDLSANKALGSLSVQESLITSLDLSANTALGSLGVADTPLTSLDLSTHKQLAELVIHGVPLTALKLGSAPSFRYTIDNPTKASLTAKTGTPIDLKTYAPFFDASKVSNVQGGTIDANGVLTGWTSGSPVTYTYDAGFEKVLNVSIVIVDEDLKGLSLVANPFSKTYNGKAVTEQELIAGAKATYDGKEVSGKWSVENLPEIKDVGTYRPVLTFTPDSAEYESGTIETSVQINPAPFSVWVGLSNYNINTGDALPTVSLQYSGAVNGEVLESTVEPVFTGMPEQSTAGTYTIVLSNAKEVLESLKAQPTAKNYTIQLWDKASLFISRYIQLPNAPASPVEGTTGRLLMEKTFTNVPESLKAVGLDSVEKVTDKLLASVTGATKDNTVVYDVHYSISADGQTWNALTPEQFPKEGLTITLPYPEGVDTKANDFTAMHMFTQDVNGFKTGDVEVIKAVKTDAGLQMTVKGFSPIAITWAKAGTTPPTDGGDGGTTTPPTGGGNGGNVVTPPTDGGNGGNVVTPPTGSNGTTTQPTTPNPGTGAIAQTGDNSAVAVWGIVMALCATAAAGLMIVKSKGKKKQ